MMHGRSLTRSPAQARLPLPLRSIGRVAFRGPSCDARLCETKQQWLTFDEHTGNVTVEGYEWRMVWWWLRCSGFIEAQV